MMPEEPGETTQRRPALPNGTSPASSSTRSRLNVEFGVKTRLLGAPSDAVGITFDYRSTLSVVRSARHGAKTFVGRGQEEVNLTVLELGIQGLLIKQLRGLGFDEDSHSAVIDEGIARRRLGHEHELEPLVAGGDACMAWLTSRSGWRTSGDPSTIDRQLDHLAGFGRRRRTLLQCTLIKHVRAGQR
jgi:hypothetical protein